MKRRTKPKTDDRPVSLGEVMARMSPASRKRIAVRTAEIRSEIEAREKRRRKAKRSRAKSKR